MATNIAAESSSQVSFVIIIIIYNNYNHCRYTVFVKELVPGRRAKEHVLVKLLDHIVYPPVHVERKNPARTRFV